MSGMRCRRQVSASGPVQRLPLLVDEGRILDGEQETEHTALCRPARFLGGNQTVPGEHGGQLAIERRLQVRDVLFDHPDGQSREGRHGRCLSIRFSPHPQVTHSIKPVILGNQPDDRPG